MEGGVLPFLSRSEKMGGKFFFPPMTDIASVPSNNTVYVLPELAEEGATKGQKSYFTFGINYHFSDVC